MTGHVNHDRAGQDQNVIFPLGDLHSVGVAPGNHCFETVALRPDCRQNSYSWSVKSLLPVSVLIIETLAAWAWRVERLLRPNG